MRINLDEYRQQLVTASPHTVAILEASFVEAAKVMSTQGLTHYLDGSVTLYNLGRNPNLVIAYLQELPAVSKAVGEAIIPDVITHAMQLSSMVSGEIISLLFTTLPAAAQRLGDIELVRAYLNLIHQLSAKAPRGLRPMLTHSDELFAKLTLGGIRRWALWGAQAHNRDYDALSRYFSLESEDSKAVLQRERRGTLFVDNQRKLNFYLRALWGRDFYLRPTSGDFENREGLKPFIEHGIIHLADACDDYADISGKERYRATSAHAAAHLVYAHQAISAEALTPVQMFIIGLFEDARIEQLAIQDFPGLKKLWLPFHQSLSTVSCSTDPIVNQLERIAHALIDETYQDPAAVINQSAADFRHRFQATPNDNQIAWDCGITLANQLAEKHPLPSLRVLESMAIAYRDDNRVIWAFDDNIWQNNQYVAASQQQVRRTVSAIEMAHELDCELAGDDAQEIWTLDTEFFRDGDPDGASLNQLEGKEPISEPVHYPEWDYQIQLHRPDWVTIHEKRPLKGDVALIDQMLLTHKPLASRIRQIIDALQPQGLVRLRNQEEGDEIDINAAIRAHIDMRMGEIPDTKINIRYLRNTRDLAVLLLLDLSESTNETLPGSERTILQLTQEATALVSGAIHGIGDPFAIHGFASDGRQDVQYFRFKDFNQPYDDEIKAKLAGMQSGLSTRMGGALRHARSFLQKQPQQKKLVLLISDGEPADIDVRDPQYLRHDTKKAVEALSTHGIATFCLTVDPDADNYVSRIFGSNNFSVIDNVQKLPEKLPNIFMKLTK